MLFTSNKFDKLNDNRRENMAMSRLVQYLFNPLDSISVATTIIPISISLLITRP